MALDPQFTSVPKVGYGYLLAPSDNYDGTAVNAVACFTAGSNGSFVSFVRLKPNGVNNGATVIRIFLNNGSDPTVATNNQLITELQLNAATGNASTATLEGTANIGFAIPGGYKILALTSNTANSGWHVTVVGGDY